MIKVFNLERFRSVGACFGVNCCRGLPTYLQKQDRKTFWQLRWRIRRYLQSSMRYKMDLRGGSFSVIELLVGLISRELVLRIPRTDDQAGWEHPFRIAHLHA
jgi:hypothetical protein